MATKRGNPCVKVFRYGNYEAKGGELYLTRMERQTADLRIYLVAPGCHMFLTSDLTPAPILSSRRGLCDVLSPASSPV